MNPLTAEITEMTGVRGFLISAGQIAHVQLLSPIGAEDGDVGVSGSTRRLRRLGTAALAVGLLTMAVLIGLSVIALSSGTHDPWLVVAAGLATLHAFYAAYIGLASARTSVKIEEQYQHRLSREPAAQSTIERSNCRGREVFHFT